MAVNTRAGNLTVACLLALERIGNRFPIVVVVRKHICLDVLNGLKRFKVSFLA